MKRFPIVVLSGVLASAVAVVAGADTITGEVIDTVCYTTMGARGASHKQCGIDCAKKGIPVALLESGTNKVYVLLPNKDKGALPDAVINKMGSEATITGTVHTTGGSTFLTVESVK